MKSLCLEGPLLSCLAETCLPELLEWGFPGLWGEVDVVVKSLCLEGPFLSCFAGTSFPDPAGLGVSRVVRKSGQCSKEFVFGGTISELPCRNEFP